MSVQLPPELREAARLLQARLRGGVTGVKWVAPEQLHLTLYFLGEISLEQTAVLKAIMGRLKNGGPFPLELSGGGAFPSAAKP